MLSLNDLDYFRPHTRRIFLLSKTEGLDPLGEIGFDGLFVFNKPTLDRADNLSLPDGSSKYCSSLRHASFGLLRLAEWGSDYMRNQLEIENTTGITGVAKCSDWIDIEIVRPLVNPQILDQLARIEPGLLTITFDFGMTQGAAKVLPIMAIRIEFVGAAA